ncbi:hypothetical protein, partial [Amycolatopsis sp. SID8362]|uniref:hypothetical protein n=1 Tax=Amycolatopsis sp. SID8362 TaxID=2690346 RepID=UPI00136CC765
WAAVERADVGALSSALALDGTALTPVLPALSSWRRRLGERHRVDGLRYRVTWLPLTGTSSTVDGEWAVVVPDGHERDDWAVSVVAALGDVRVVVAGAGLAERLAGAGLTGVVSLMDGEDVLAELLDAGIGAPLWCVTRGAVAVGRAEGVRSLPQAGTWGLGRVLALEHPHRWGGLIDLPDVVDERVAARFRGVL